MSNERRSSPAHPSSTRRPPRGGRASAASLLVLLVAACGEAATAGGAGGTGGGGAGGGAGQGGMGGAPPKGEATWTVVRHELDLDLATRAAVSRLTLDLEAPGGDCVRLPNTPKLELALWNGQPSTSLTQGADEVLLCGTPTGPGPLLVETHQVIPKKKYLGLDVGYSERFDLSGATFRYLLSWVGGCDRFGPCDDSPALLAPIVLTVTHPEGETVLCPGARVAGATQTTCSLEGTLAPTYSGVGVAADASYVRTPFVQAAGVGLDFYEVPGGGLASALDPVSVSALLTWLVGRLGPLPYGPELRVAGGPTAWLGFEHPANIVLQEDLSSAAGAYKNPTFHVLAHEIVHQWAGDRTTLATAVDFAWKEAIAEYLTFVFEDESRPAAEAAASLLYWDTLSIGSAWHVRPTDEPPPAVEAFFGDVYGPGPMVLFVQLEALLGREVVLTALASFLAGGGARAVSDLRAALEVASGEDLGPYWAAWVEGAGPPEWPTFLVQTTPNAGDLALEVTQTSPSGALHGCVVEVLVQGATQSAVVTFDYGVAPSSAVVSATIPFPEAVVSVVVDPNHKVVDLPEAMPLFVKVPAWIL